MMSFFKVLAIAAAAVSALPGAPEQALMSDDECQSNDDSGACALNALQRQRVETVGSLHKPMPIAGKSIYIVMIDRFARSNGNDTECGFTDGFDDNNWCNGTVQGILDQLDYIQGMGFEGIWITPIVEQRPGNHYIGYGAHGYWAKNFYEVDPHYGTQGDVVALADELHKRGMVFIMDIVANHVGPIHSAADLDMFYPFNKPEHYHQLNIGNMTFDEYVYTDGTFPPGKICLGGGALCPAGSDLSCACYSKETHAFNETSGCPKDSMDIACHPGTLACEGYNQTVIEDGWFFDLGDLNQSNPFVHEELLKWVKWLKTTFKLDGIRLDTAPYMSIDFLSALQEAAEVPIIGEATVSNLTYHASFQALPPPHGKQVISGVLNFPLTWVANAAFCGMWYPNSYLNLSTLASRTNEQLNGVYKDLDLLGNFQDTHDQDRLTKMCTNEQNQTEMGRIYNSLAWAFFTKGMPMYFYGTETLFVEQRGSFWQTGFNTSRPGYQFVKRMNLIRKQTNIGLSDLEIEATAGTPKGQLVLRRGGVKGTYAFLNNRAMDDQGPEDYCLWVLPESAPGQVWVDGISGIPAALTEGCYHAPDSMPKILLQMRRCNEKQMGHTKFFYDMGCLEAEGEGCKADGENQECRYCGQAPYPDCPKAVNPRHLY